MKYARSHALAAMVLVTGLGLAACTNDNVGQKQAFGTLGGAALGGLAGAQIGNGRGQLAATAAGAVLGALLGNEIGASLDRADQAYMRQTTLSTLENQPTGTSVPWHNPDSGHRGAVKVERTYEPSPGHYCREFRQTVEIDGRTEIATGTACRQSDGTWRITDN